MGLGGAALEASAAAAGLKPKRPALEARPLKPWPKRPLKSNPQRPLKSQPKRPPTCNIQPLPRPANFLWLA